MVVLRFKRFGRIHRPTYRLCAADKRCPRNGTVIEELGWFDPAGPEGKQFEFNMERVAHWFKMGAQPSQTAANMIKKAGGTIPAAAIKALSVRSKVSKHPKPAVVATPAAAAEETPKGE
ncbi:MAG: 30S ribosomal protein S16 [Phycisphaerales bacterium]